MKSALFALLIAISFACAHRQSVAFVPGKAVGYNERNGLAISISWLKNKETSVDLMLSLTNGYKRGIKIKKSGIKLSVNGEPGVISRSDFSGELAANGGSERGLLVFKFSNDVPKTGTASLLITDITSEDGSKTYPDLMISVPAVN